MTAITVTYHYENTGSDLSATVTVDRAEALDAAARALRAEKRSDGRWGYRDDATHETVAVSEDDLVELGAGLLDGKDLGVLYSLWCSSTDCEWLTAYEATIYDGNPADSGDCAWPEEIEVEAASAEKALEQALRKAAAQARGMADYPEGTRLWAIMRDEDGDWAAQGSTTV